MNFDKELNKYINIIGCTGKELSETSGIAEPIISGYRTGSRIPKYNSAQLENLIKALAKLAKNKNVKQLDEKIIRKGLEDNLDKQNIDFEIFRNNFNQLIGSLSIKTSNLAKYMGYDSSFISKVRTGNRKPLNIADFADGVCKYVTGNYLNTQHKIISDLIKFGEEDLKSGITIYDKLYFWLTNNTYIETQSYNIDSFFRKLDDFDLNNYIKSIKFDKLFVPTIPKVLFKTKIFYGFEGYKNSQLEVLKQTAFSKSEGEVFWYSNMPMIEASKDLKFVKTYMMYVAFILKKGLKLNIVHDLDRSFKELMLGLEGWIPLYMTGQINPYYFKNNSNILYSNIECVSESAILHGECITGNINKSKILVSNNKDDIKYYTENSKLLLKKAHHLMDIYNSAKKEEFNKVINEYNIAGDRRNILINLPIYTISDKLLKKILTRNKIPSEEQRIIIDFIDDQRKNISLILKSNKVLDEIVILSRDEFEKNKCILDLSKLFYSENEIRYTYQEYQEHMKLLEEFKKSNTNYNYKINKNHSFKNININIIEDKQVIISKTNLPFTHFIIHHPKLINAIQNFKTTIVEKNYI